MRALNRKLLRDLWAIKGQVLAIGAVIAVGVIMFIAYLSTFDSLRATQQAYYDRYRMADLFVSLVRAPRSLEERLSEINGVARVRTRVVADVPLDVPESETGREEPITGRLVSIPEGRAPPAVSDANASGKQQVAAGSHPADTMLNGIALLDGRWIEADRPDEVIVSEGFAVAHGLQPGDGVAAVIHGRRRELRVVGIGLSPEFVYTIRPGELMPDDARFGILWMGREALGTAFDMEGGFNDVVLTLAPGASEEEVIARVDRLLEPYGGLGTIARSLQVSNWYLDNELRQLQGFGLIVPFLFLGVAAFLLNVVLGRIVSVQRGQIAALGALGYGRREIGWHYVSWSLVISGLGSLAGLVLGHYLGHGMTRMYNEYFRFPFLDHQVSPRVVLGALGISLVAAIVGALGAVRSAISLPPAEAMRPEPPARYRRTLVERLGLAAVLSPPTRMVLRNLERRPFRFLASVVGVACSGGLLIIGLFFADAIDELLEMQFHVIQRQDLTVSLVEPRSSAALHELSRLPGVSLVEPSRSVAVRLRSGHRSRQTAISGLVAEPRLQRVVETDGTVVKLPPDGLLVSAKLAEILDLERGSPVQLEVLEGRRPRVTVVVADLVDEYMGTSVYMELDALRRLLREGNVVTGAYLHVDPRSARALYERLGALPAVAGVALTSAAVETFRNQMDEMMGVFIGFTILFASVITIGVVYNAARVALSERSRELASLRVLGFTRAEISSILLGELALVTVVAIPFGSLLGYGFAAFMVASFDTELYRFPLVVSSRSHAIAALVVTLAATLSGLVVRRRLDHLDLVEVLKTRE